MQVEVYGRDIAGCSQRANEQVYTQPYLVLTWRSSWQSEGSEASHNAYKVGNVGSGEEDRSLERQEDTCPLSRAPSPRLQLS